MAGYLGYGYDITVPARLRAERRAEALGVAGSGGA
jgi:hypothetical protein